MEHVSSQRQFLEQIRTLLKPEGCAFVSMTPFHGPLGDHMGAFFRVQIPWRGVLFSKDAILQLRRECFRPSTPARNFNEIEGGLNLMTVSEYFRNIESAGLEVVTHRFDPHFYHYKKLWPLAPVVSCTDSRAEGPRLFHFQCLQCLAQGETGFRSTRRRLKRSIRSMNRTLVRRFVATGGIIGAR